MKKFLLSLFAVLTATFAFAGDGTKENPYTVADLQKMDASALTDAEAWVKAFIVGSANNKLEAFVTTADGAVASNLMIADAQSETDYTKCAPVQLASKSAPRAALNLVDNPTNLGKTLLVKGTISKYFGVVGVKNIAEYELSGEGVEPGPGPEPGTGIANTPETAYTTSEALDILASDADLTPNVYVKGTVASISELSTEYGNATFFLTDGSKELYIFRAKYLEGTTFTDEDQLKVGDEVIACGQLKNYVKDDTTTPELSNCYTYSVNGKTKLDGSGEETKTITVAEAQALTSGTAKVNATVYALCKNGAVFGDQTGYIYYYNTGISGLAIGDQVTVEGALSKYGGFNQFTSAATITKTGSAAVTYPAAAEMDVDAWVAAPAIQYVKLTGELSVSGNYYNILVEGKTAQGSVVGAQDELFKDIASGSTITVEGFAMYTSGSGKYANIVATKVTVDGQGEQVDITNTPETAYSIAKVIELVDAGKGLEQKVYVKGIISEIVSLDVTRWQRAQYDIVDTEGSDVKVRVYNGYFLEGHDFVANDQIKVGDVVVVYGQLTLYTPKEGDPIYEVAANNFIYSLNGETVDGVSGIQADLQNGAIYDLSGRRVEKAVKGIYIVNGKKVVF